MSKLVTDITQAHIIAIRENKDRIVVDCGHTAVPDYFLTPRLGAID
jgi:hypothetical protein